MVRFPRTSRMTNYLSRREQRKLLMMVGLLGLVVIMMFEARKPENWSWMWSGQATVGDGRTSMSESVQQVQPDAGSVDRAPGGAASTDEESAATPSSDDESPETETPTADSNTTDAASPSTNGNPSPSPSHAEHPASGVDAQPKETAQPDATSQPNKSRGRPNRVSRNTPSGEPLPEVPRRLLKKIQDGTVFRSAEHEAWFQMISILEATPQPLLEEASRGSITMTQLIAQPDLYRGKLITTRGTVRRVIQTDAAENELGIQHYYQLWLQPADNPLSPMVVYCLHLPKGFPLGNTINEEVQLTGYFFKIWAYQGQQKVEAAPLLLAREIRWSPRPVRETNPVKPRDLWIVAAAALGLAGVMVVIVRRRERGDRLREPGQKPRRLQPPRDEALDELDDPSDGVQALKHLNLEHARPIWESETESAGSTAQESDDSSAASNPGQENDA